jgi:hypothetical protein
MIARRPAFCHSRRVGVAVLCAVVTLAVASAAFGLPPFTTLAKSSPSGTVAQAQLASVTAACRATFDRLVFRFRFGIPGYRVRYVAQVVKDPSGLPLSLPGNAKLQITFQNARAHTAAGGALPIPSVLTPSCANLLKLKKAGDFEGVVSYGAGIDHRAGFRVFRLSSPTRVVIDIHH